MTGKIKRYFKYRKINKYLKSKNNDQYNCLDNILICYVNGKLQNILESYNFNKINIYSVIGKKGNYLQIECFFYNLTVNIEFDENSFNYIMYVPGISADDFDKSIIKKEYEHDFNIENFFKDLIKECDEQFKLHLQVKDKPEIDRKRRLYTLISRICWLILIVLCGGLSIYVIVTGNTITVSPLFAIFFMLIPFMIALFFHFKSLR